MANEVAKKEFNTAVSQWSTELTNLVIRDFDSVGVPFDDYSRTCAMNAMTGIFQLVRHTQNLDMNKLDTSNLRQIVGQCASLKLNANAVPREVYFQIRNKQVNGEWVKEVEMGIEGDGNDALLRNYGSDVDTVYPVWIVKEGDDFKFPKRVGLNVTPPEWEEKGLSNRVVRVVYPVKMKDGTIQYLMADRDSVKVNLIAHIRNSMMNETFGICKDRYKASDAQKEQIKAKKNEILDAVRKCETVDDILACEVARPFISAAWLDTPESMITRKMRNNAIKKFPKDLNSMARQSLLDMDETYQNVQAEIAENANKEEFIPAEESNEVTVETTVVEHEEQGEPAIDLPFN